MTDKIKIVALSGSLRKDSFNRRVLGIAASGAENAGAEIINVNLLDYPLPHYNPDIHGVDSFDENALALQKMFAESDGFLVASPEYNGSLPSALKNAIDWTSRTSKEFGMGEVFRNKFGAIMTASPGSFGGIRSLLHLRDVLTIIGIQVIPTQIAVSFAGDKFDGNSSEMTDEKTKKSLENMGATLVKMVSLVKANDLKLEASR